MITHDEAVRQVMTPELPPDVWVIENPWRTCATALVGRISGDAKVTRGLEPAGVHAFATRDTKYYLPHDLAITQLVYRDDRLMTDSPRNYFGMLELAHRARGRVLVGGVGLGIVQRLLRCNPAVSLVETVELLPDVALLEGLVETPVYLGDLFDYAGSGEYDTLLTDFAPVSPDDPSYQATLDKLEAIRARFPRKVYLHFGYQRYFDVKRFDEEFAACASTL